MGSIDPEGLAAEAITKALIVYPAGANLPVLFTTLYHLRIDELRKRSRAIRHGLVSSLEEVQEANFGLIEKLQVEPSAEEEAIKRETYQEGQIRAEVLLSKLPLMQRIAVAQTVIKEIPYEETAAMLGKDSDSIKSNQSRGLNNLAKELRPGEPVPRRRQISSF